MGRKTKVKGDGRAKGATTPNQSTLVVQIEEGVFVAVPDKEISPTRGSEQAFALQQKGLERGTECALCKHWCDGSCVENSACSKIHIRCVNGTGDDIVGVLRTNGIEINSPDDSSSIRGPIQARSADSAWVKPSFLSLKGAGTGESGLSSASTRASGTGGTTWLEKLVPHRASCKSTIDSVSTSKPSASAPPAQRGHHSISMEGSRNEVEISGATLKAPERNDDAIAMRAGDAEISLPPKVFSGSPPRPEAGNPISTSDELSRALQGANSSLEWQPRSTDVAVSSSPLPQFCASFGTASVGLGASAVPFTYASGSSALPQPPSASVAAPLHPISSLLLWSEAGAPAQGKVEPPSAGSRSGGNPCEDLLLLGLLSEKPTPRSASVKDLATSAKLSKGFSVPSRSNMGSFTPRSHTSNSTLDEGLGSFFSASQKNVSVTPVELLLGGPPSASLTPALDSDHGLDKKHLLQHLIGGEEDEVPVKVHSSDEGKPNCLLGDRSPPHMLSADSNPSSVASISQGILTGNNGMGQLVMNPTAFPSQMVSAVRVPHPSQGRFNYGADLYAPPQFRGGEVLKFSTSVPVGSLATPAPFTTSNYSNPRTADAEGFYSRGPLAGAPAQMNPFSVGGVGAVGGSAGYTHSRGSPFNSPSVQHLVALLTGDEE